MLRRTNSLAYRLARNHLHHAGLRLVARRRETHVVRAILHDTYEGGSARDQAPKQINNTLANLRVSVGHPQTPHGRSHRLCLRNPI